MGDTGIDGYVTLQRLQLLPVARSPAASSLLWKTTEQNQRKKKKKNTLEYSRLCLLCYRLPETQRKSPVVACSKISSGFESPVENTRAKPEEEEEEKHT
ncbi:hypothetical protein EJ110_NYTH58679 [Nymphaea thermarum]|nr:hypothetical protein EJ110_NYTH58679 [Nymphaea thermarum]